MRNSRSSRPGNVDAVLDILEGLCTRAIWVAAGKIVADGPAAEVIARYRAAVEAR